LNHKRGKPKHQRAGCLYCKPHKSKHTSKAKDRERPTVRRKKQPEPFYCQCCGAERAEDCGCERGES